MNRYEYKSIVMVELTDIKSDGRYQIGVNGLDTLFVDIVSLIIRGKNHHGSLYLTDYHHGSGYEPTRRDAKQSGEGFNIYHSLRLRYPTGSGGIEATSASREKAFAMIVPMINAWVVANPQLLLQGRRLHMTNQLHRLQESIDEAAAELKKAQEEFLSVEKEYRQLK